MEHESTTTIPVPPERLYGALANVGNLTRLIPAKLTLHLTTAHASDIKQYVADTFETIRRQF